MWGSATVSRSPSWTLDPRSGCVTQLPRLSPFPADRIAIFGWFYIDQLAAIFPWNGHEMDMKWTWNGRAFQRIGTIGLNFTCAITSHRFKPHRMTRLALGRPRLMDSMTVTIKVDWIKPNGAGHIRATRIECGVTIELPTWNPSRPGIESSLRFIPIVLSSPL